MKMKINIEQLQADLIEAFSRVVEHNLFTDKRRWVKVKSDVPITPMMLRDAIDSFNNDADEKSAIGLALVFIGLTLVLDERYESVSKPGCISSEYNSNIDEMIDYDWRFKVVNKAGVGILLVKHSVWSGVVKIKLAKSNVLADNNPCGYIMETMASYNEPDDFKCDVTCNKHDEVKPCNKQDKVNDEVNNGVNNEVKKDGINENVNTVLLCRSIISGEMYLAYTSLESCVMALLEYVSEETIHERNLTVHSIYTAEEFNKSIKVGDYIRLPKLKHTAFNETREIFKVISIS